MVKQIVTASSLVAVMLLSSGCNQVQPKPAVVETKTTKEVLVPHNDNVKKAVVLLINKSKQYDEFMSSKNNNASCADSAEIKALQNKIDTIEKRSAQLKEDREKFNKVLSDMQKGFAMPASAVPSKVNNGAKVATEVVESPTEYDEVIKEFAEEGSLK